MLLYKLTLETFGYDKLPTLKNKKKIMAKCDYCGIIFAQAMIYYMNSKRGKGFNKTCCHSCGYKKTQEINLATFGTKGRKQSPETKERLHKTMVEKYGEDYKSIMIKRRAAGFTKEKMAESRKKAKQTMLERYGVEHFSQSERGRKEHLERMSDPNVVNDIREKREQTLLERTGHKNAMGNPESVAKIKLTMKERYGVDNPMEIPGIKEKIIKANIEKYGFESPMQSEVTKEKIRNTNLERYGATNPMKNPDVIAKSKATSIETGNIRTYDGLRINEWAEKVGLSRTHAGALLREHGTEFFENYQRNYSDIEILVMSVLDKNNISYTAHEVIAGRKTDFRVDNLIIECDSNFWHSDLNGKPSDYHLIKKQDYQKAGYDSLFFRSDEIYDKLEIIESVILGSLGKFKKDLSLNFDIQPITQEEAHDFISKNSLEEFKSGEAFGVFCDLELCAATSVVITEENLEILNFSVKNFYNHYGIFEVLLDFLVAKYSPRKISRVINLRFEDDKELISFGFDFKGISPSFIWTDGKKTFPKETFLDDGSHSRKLGKFWDCGNAKYEKSLQ
jgi:hypothetical protein